MKIFQICLFNFLFFFLIFSQFCFLYDEISQNIASNKQIPFSSIQYASVNSLAS